MPKIYLLKIEAINFNPFLLFAVTHNIKDQFSDTNTTLFPASFLNHLLLQISRHRLSGSFCNGNLFLMKFLYHRSPFLWSFIHRLLYFFCSFLLVVHLSIDHIIIDFCSRFMTAFIHPVLKIFLIKLQLNLQLFYPFCTMLLWMAIFTDLLFGSFVKSSGSCFRDKFPIAVENNPRCLLSKFLMFQQIKRKRLIFG